MSKDILESKVLKKMKAGKLALCTKINLKDPAIIEMSGLLGFDCLWLCKEHLWPNDETLANMILGARNIRVDTLVRIEKYGFEYAIKPLEMGAKGIMAPHIMNADDARNAVQAMKYPSIGSRGIGGGGADSDWGSMSMKEYVEFSNKETFIILQIEDPEAVENIEEIASVPGFDMLLVGVFDLSATMGFPGEIEKKEIWDVVEKVAKTAIKYGKFAAAVSTTPEHTQRLINMGHLFINIGADAVGVRKYYLELTKECKRFGFLSSLD